MKHAKNKKPSPLSIPAGPELKAAIEADAKFEGTTRAHVVRRILLEHYRSRGRGQGATVAV